MALALFRPREDDMPLNFLLPTVQPPDSDRVAQAVAQAKQNGSGTATEVAFLHGAQGTFVGDLHIARIDDAGDDLAQFICGVINQTPLLAQRHALEQSADALRQRNEELYLSENRLAAVINSSLDAILCVDSDLRITVFNPAAAALFGCPAEQALASRCSASCLTWRACRWSRRRASSARCRRARPAAARWRWRSVPRASASRAATSSRCSRAT